MALTYERNRETAERQIAATEARVHFGELTRDVEQTGEPVLVERNGRAVVVVLPVEEYRRLQRGGRDDGWRERLRATQEAWQRILDPSVPVNAADLIREGHEESDAWMDDALSRR